MSERVNSPIVVAVDPSARLFSGGRVVAGGAPWRLSRLRGDAASFLRRAYWPGSAVVPDLSEVPAVQLLLERGLVHPRPALRSGPHSVSVVVPAYGQCPGLGSLLQVLRGLEVVVVDDGTPEPSPIREAVAEGGAVYVRLNRNSGPAAARNEGLRHVSSELVALVDADCRPARDWLDRLVPHFDDERVAMVAPRVVADVAGGSLLERYESASSALDMGSRPALVRPGAKLGFVPSAALLVRRQVVITVGFDESLRLGEDVDLVWRLADAGWHVRYEPSATVSHANRSSWRSWARRRFDYGTSAVQLEDRHPGRLTPLRLSPWSAAAFVAVSAGMPTVAASIVAAAGVQLVRGLDRSGVSRGVGAYVLGAGLLADGAAVGHALRREYWPLGAAALAASLRRPSVRLAAGLVLAPVALEWARERPALDPLRYTAVRLVADAAYGSGVLAACAQARTIRPLMPRIRPARGAAAGGASSTT